MPGLTGSLRDLHRSLSSLVRPRSEFLHIPMTKRTAIKTKWILEILLRDALHKAHQRPGILGLHADNTLGPALAPLLGIVTEYIRPGDGFHERIELLFTSLGHLFGASGVFLECEIPASSLCHFKKGGSVAHPLPLLREISPDYDRLTGTFL
jgi:hypothetical protein